MNQREVKRLACAKLAMNVLSMPLPHQLASADDRKRWEDACWELHLLRNRRHLTARPLVDPG